MPGGLLQLSSYGSASTYLHSNPQITFWKQVWRRSTAFALESIEMPFSGSAPDFGTKVTAPISKGADMAHRAWLEITLPDLADYSTTQITATSTQPLIQRAYIEGDYVKLRVAPPASGSWTDGWYIVQASGTFGMVSASGDGASPSEITVSTSSAHGLLAGASVTISGATTAALNGAWTLSSVTNTSFTFTSSTNGVTTATLGGSATLTTYVTGSDPTYNTLFQIQSGTYTDHAIPRADLPVAWTSNAVSLTAMAVDSGYESPSSESMPRTVMNLKWCNSIGHALLESVEWEIGGTRIDKIPNADYFDVWSELTEKEEKRLGFNAMVGKYDNYDIWDETKSTRGGKTFFVPLLFSFCQSPSQSIPIISLQFHESRINVNFREALDLVKCNVPVSALIGPTGAPITLPNCQLYVDMVFLDTEERRRMSAMEHEALLTQIQYLGDYTISPNDPGMVKKIPLDGLNHPIKELIWVYQGWSRYQRDAVNGNDHFNYQLAADPTEDPFVSVRLTLNGTERMPPRSGQYFRQVQPYQHHTRVPTKYVHCYNFGLEPESTNPTGSCNFSRLEQASLNVTLSPNVDVNGGKIKVFALGFNVLRYAQGLAGLAFTSG
jgi:hypothetical protein